MELIAGEQLERGDVAYVENGKAYKYRFDDDSVDCKHHMDVISHNNERVYDCSDWEIECVLDLPNRKYCRYYKPVEREAEVNAGK